jgi:DNA-binding SARP family transcriptional activator
VLSLLGPPTVIHTGGRIAPWPRTRPGALLAFLACRDGWVSRDELATLFRPDESDADARRYLRQLLHRAASLPWVEGLELVDDRVRWSVDGDLRRLRAALRTGDAEALLAAPTGDLLAGYAPPGVEAFEAWLELEREELRARWCATLRRLARESEALAEDERAAALRERSLEIDPLDEACLQALLHACLRLAQPERALAAYRRFAAALERDVGAAPLEATEALADAARGHGVVPVAADGRGSLPRPATSFVGRAAELERLQRSWREGARLVSIVGLGGVGKTRLALELAHRERGRFGGGTAFVAVTASASVSELCAAVAAGFAVATHDTAPAAIAARLGDAERLLVLDEAEHMPPGELGDLLVTLVSGAPGLHVLVTSRSPLGVHAEHVLALDGLDGDGTGDAAALFEQRLSRWGVEIPADAASRAAVEALCRALGGVPLAIELAAARARVRGVPATLADLQGSIAGLRTDELGVPERHRNLQRLVHQAWESLQPALRDALVRLTVFRTSCSSAAAERVALVDLQTLTALLDRSMLRRSDVDRFEVHALIRRAAPHDPDPATRDAHAAYVLGALAERTPALTGGDEQPRALDEAHGVLADVRRAWAWAAVRGAWGALDGALQALDHVLHARHLWAPARELYTAVVEACAAAADDATARRLCDRTTVRLANVERNLADTDAARSRLDALIARWPGGGVRPGVVSERVCVEAWLERAKLDAAVYAYAAAAQSLHIVLSCAAPCRDDDLAAQAHSSLSGVLFASGGDLDQAMDHAEAAVALARGVGDGDLLSIALINLGAAHHDLGRPAAARRYWREAAELCAAIGHRRREAVVLSNLAAASEALGDEAAARDAYERSLALRQALGDRTGVARALLYLGRLALHATAWEEADAYVEAAVRAFEQVDDTADLSWALALHARVRLGLGDGRSARRCAERALQLGRLANDRVGLLSGVLAVAALLEDAGDAAAAARLASSVGVHSEGRDAGLHASALSMLAALRSAALEPRRDEVPSLDAVVDEALAALERRWNADGTRPR